VRREAGCHRNRWFDDYIKLAIEHDVAELSRIRQREKMPQLIARMAGQTAQILNLVPRQGDPD
jgi:hypothetical protein